MEHEAVYVLLREGASPEVIAVFRRAEDAYGTAIELLKLYVCQNFHPDKAMKCLGDINAVIANTTMALNEKLNFICGLVVGFRNYEPLVLYDVIAHKLS